MDLDIDIVKIETILLNHKCTDYVNFCAKCTDNFCVIQHLKNYLESLKCVDCGVYTPENACSICEKNVCDNCYHYYKAVYCKSCFAEYKL